MVPASPSRGIIERLLAMLKRQRPPKFQTRFTYTDGPMVFIGQQIIRHMEQSGWDPKFFETYRSPEKQNEYFRKGTSKAKPWSSPHQYWLAVDIISKKAGWPPSGHRFWQDLAAAARVVSDKFDFPLELGYDWGWDSAHIEFKDFRKYRSQYYGREMTQAEKDKMFSELLPKVWKQYLKSKAGQMRVGNAHNPLN